MKTICAVALLCFASAVFAQMPEHHHDADETFGKVSFPISCAAGTQEAFTKAVAQLHSFAYEDAETAFTEIAERDPRCGIAWWGVAMTNYHPVWPSPYSPAELARGIAAAKKAESVGATTPRERAYIDAIATFYRDADKLDVNTRGRAYEAKMAALTAQYPDDDEAAIFYGLSLVAHGMSMPTDKSYTYQKKAAAIFNGLLAKHPDHPGIAHYLIHSFDYPALAPLALNAAYAYSKIAPAAPHALHMPSHIFVRLGMWDETIDSNIRSADAAKARASKLHPGSMAFDSLHAYDYLTYAYLQRGEDEQARKLVDEIAGITSINVENFAGYYAIAAIPARYAVERHRWDDAAALTVPPGFPWERYGYAEAITHYARAVGAARSGHPEHAQADVDRLAVLRQKLLDQHNAYWADQVDVQRRASEAWIAWAEGRRDNALTAMRSAADLEDSMDKSPVTPGAIVPAREMLGELLLDMNRPGEALEAFERSLAESPNRLNALTGAARAAQLSGDRAKAAGYYGRVAGLLGNGPETR
jgi:tetratricopeptide (TPR) repeat protein